LTFILPELDEEEGVVRLLLKASTVITNRVSGTHFQCAPINIDEERRMLRKLMGKIFNQKFHQRFYQHYGLGIWAGFVLEILYCR